jgi:hypothetical protein
MADYLALATLIILGPRLSKLGSNIYESLSNKKVKDRDLLFSVSKIERGIILRIAGKKTEIVSDFIKSQLQPLHQDLKCDIWTLENT